MKEMPSARKREEKQEAEIKKKKTYPTSPRETEKLFETRKKNLRRGGRNFERKKKKRKKEREEEKINSNESKEKKTRREEKKKQGQRRRGRIEGRNVGKEERAR